MEIREAPQLPVVGLLYRLPKSGHLREVVVTVDDVVETPEGKTVVIGHNLLGQNFGRTVGE